MVFQAPKYASVAIDVPLRNLFTYRVPERLQSQIEVGKRVLVSFGRKTMIGICVSFSSESTIDKLKEVQDVIDEQPLLEKNYLLWLGFAAEYYAAPMGQVLAGAIPSFYLDPKKIGKEAKVKFKPISFDSSFKTKTVTLSSEQEVVYQDLVQHLHHFYPVLLQGITGSGKTEVYIQVIKEVLKKNQSALFLVPEIGLTPQMLARLKHHFKGSLLVYHSSLTVNQRWDQWTKCLENKPRIMVGTRSALFAPFKNLGLIVVDEEQDHSYKQEERFRYHARNLAVGRAKELGIPVIMGSATPSLETYYQAKKEKYKFYQLHSRFGDASLPDIRVIDYSREQEQTGAPLCVSQHIHDAIDHFHKKKQQMIIFVGQRGFAQNAYCLSCHEIQVCPNCSVGLKYHKLNKSLKCHYCDFEKTFDEICLSCQEKALTLLGFGTQSVEDEIKSLHPRVRIRRLDSDAVSTEKELRTLFNEFSTGQIDLIVGTQMISKGHDFENIGFVGVLGIDAHLGLPDFRASERAFQNLVQVAGRAGRAEKKGHVIVQSLMPDHDSIQFGVKQDYMSFAEHELRLRKVLFYPPFSRLVQIRFLSPQLDRLKDFMQTWALYVNHVRKKTNKEHVQILGPSEMPIAKIRGKYRYHVLLKIKRGLKVSDIVNYLISDLDKRKLRGIQYQVDVDAVGMV